MSAAGSGEEERGERKEERDGTAHVGPCPRDPHPGPLLDHLRPRRRLALKSWGGDSEDPGVTWVTGPTGEALGLPHFLPFLAQLLWFY